METRFEKWLYVIKNLHKLDRIPENLKEKIFLQVFATAEISKFTKQEYQEYEDNLKNYRDLQNSFDTARGEGMEKGKKEGIEVEKKEQLNQNIIGLYKMGLDKEKIAEGLEVTIEKVNKVIEEYLTKR